MKDTKAGWRNELVQVAAVAVAALQDEITGSTRREIGAESYILSLVMAERQRQESKWGTRTCPPKKWLRVLVEEVGEVAGEIENLDAFELDMTYLGERAAGELEDSRGVFYQGEPIR